MSGRRVVAMVAGALLGVGVGVVGSGMVGAQPDRPQRFSDRVTFSGLAFPAPVPGSYTFTSQACSLASDPVSPGGPSEGPFECQQTAQFRPLGRTSTATVTGPDGKTTWSFTLTSGEEDHNGQKSLTMSGKGTELDAPEANSPASTAYPITVSGTLNVITTPFGFLLVTGSASFFESAGAP